MLMTDPKWEITYESLAAKAKTLLRDAIIKGELKPGERLTETVLAQQFGISRASLREALIELERDGLIVRYPNRGSEVIRMTKKDAADIFHFRNLIEAAALRAWESRTPDSLKRLKDAADRMRPASMTPSIERHQIDHAFHREIVLGTGNRRMAEAWDRNSTLILMLCYRASQNNPELLHLGDRHYTFLEALEEGKYTQAVEIWKFHLLETMEAYVSSVPEQA